MITLLCVPYAGGTGRGYASLQRWIGPGIQLAGLDLPGRGVLRHRPQAGSLDEAMDALTVQGQHLVNSPGTDRYGVLGHSLGALLAHRLVSNICRNGLRSPEMLAVSCCVPPHLTGALRQVGTEHLAAMAAMALLKTRPGPARESRLAAATEAGRRDLALLQGASPTTRLPVLKVPVIAIYGSDDSFRSEETMAGWARWTTASFRLHAIPGGHFCFRQHPAAYAQILRQALLAGEMLQSGLPDGAQVAGDGADAGPG